MHDRFLRRRRSAIALIGVLVAVLTATGCAGDPSPAPADEQLVEAMAWRDPGDGGGGGCGPLHGSLTSLGELLPNTRLRGPDGTERVLAEAVVVGRFTGVEPGRGLVLPVPDGPSDLPVAFDDPDAIYRTVHARLAVESVIAGEVVGDTVLVGLQVDAVEVADSRFPSLAEVEQGLPALGRVVVFLDRSVHFEYDPAVLGVVDRLFIGRVGADGRLGLPLLPPEDAGRLLEGTATLGELERAATEPVEIRDVGDCLRPVG